MSMATRDRRLVEMRVVPVVVAVHVVVVRHVMNMAEQDRPCA